MGKELKLRGGIGNNFVEIPHKRTTETPSKTPKVDKKIEKQRAALEEAQNKEAEREQASVNQHKEMVPKKTKRYEEE